VSRKLALVLSAGANFGAYHAGAWKAISEFFQPDLIVGASVGALNGWAIAGGCPPEEMIDRWLDPRIGGFVRLKLPLFPWQGILDDYRFAEGVRELFHAYRPQLPLAVAAVGLPLLRSKAFFTPSVTWRHLMASCAVPGCFPPQWIDG
jgi:NTE family protein